jgi:hypothetical protein
LGPALDGKLINCEECMRRRPAIYLYVLREKKYYFNFSSVVNKINIKRRKNSKVLVSRKNFFHAI